MVLILPPIYNFFNLFSKPLETINGITITFIFHSSSNSLARFKYCPIFLFPFIFTQWSARTSKSTRRQIIIIIITSSEFFTLVLTSSFSLMSEWQQISSGLQDSPKYSHWSQQYCGQYGLDSSSDLQFLQSLLIALGDQSKCTNYNWYHVRFLLLIFTLWIFQASFNKILLLQ